MLYSLSFSAEYVMQLFFVNVRLFGVYDVRWPFLAEIHTAPLKRFVPSSVLQAVRALRNAPAALAVFLAGVAPVVLAASGVAGDEFAPWRLASYSEWPFNLHLTGTNVLAHRLK